MTIAEGETLPDATLLRPGLDGPRPVELSDLLRGRRVVLFAVPGAFTPTCHSAHMPGFVRHKTAFDEKGVDAVVCIAVNDPHVLRAWSEATGADEAGIDVLSDADATFTRAIGMEFSAPAVGLINRSKRYAMLVEDGVVRVFHPETSRGSCEISGAESMLAAV